MKSIIFGTQKLSSKIPGFAAKVSYYIGTPIEKPLKKLPESLTATVNDITRKSFEKALDIEVHEEILTARSMSR